jgi:trans-2,3-dihydro-3-hydroxyanthranilate isomerase
MLYQMRYLHLDVFTDRPFEGNQLAVFPEPRGLTPAQMQTIAREMNFSESTFIFPPEAGGDFRMRIFTPGEELPMAGHPTIGSTFALAAEGALARGRPEFVFELGIGPTPVSLEWEDGGLSFAWMTQPLPTFGALVADRGAFAAAVGLSEADLAAGLPVEAVSCGVPFLFAPIASRRAVDSVVIDRKALARSCAGAGLDELPVFFFTTEPADAAGPKADATESACGPREESDPSTSSGSSRAESRGESSSAAARARESLQPPRSAEARRGQRWGWGPSAITERGAPRALKEVYSRMLAPGFGIYEDPATGGASGPLGCYLLHHGVVSPEAAQSVLSLQGVAMKRPSRIYISIDSRDGVITRVRVGGRAVLVGRGELTIGDF